MDRHVRLEEVDLEDNQDSRSDQGETGKSHNGSFGEDTLNSRSLDSLLPDDEDTSHLQRTNFFVLLSIVFASMCSMMLGYDQGVLAGAKDLIKRDFHLSAVQVEIIVASLNALSLIGSIAGGKCSDKLGRKKTLLIACAVFVTGALVMGLAQEFYSLLVGRCITGIGVGISLLIGPLYSSELAPARFRGLLVSCTETSINIGVLGGYIANLCLSPLPLTYAWRSMLLVSCLPGVVLLIGLVFMPESPRWLVSVGRLDKATRVLGKIGYSSEGDTSKEAVLTDVLDAISKNLELERQSDKMTWTEAAFPCLSPYAKILLIGYAIAALQQATGIEAVLYYTPDTARDAGFHSDSTVFWITIAVGVVKTVVTLISSFFIDKTGRRTLILLSSVGIVLSLSGVGIGFIVKDITGSPVAAFSCLVFLWLFVASFAIGWGPIAWVLVAELFPQCVRGKAMGTATFLNRAVSFVLALSFLSIANAFTTATVFLMFATIALAGLVCMFIWLPETKQRSLEEITAELCHIEPRK